MSVRFCGCCRIVLWLQGINRENLDPLVNVIKPGAVEYLGAVWTFHGNFQLASPVAPKTDRAFAEQRPFDFCDYAIASLVERECCARNMLEVCNQKGSLPIGGGSLVLRNLFPGCCKPLLSAGRWLDGKKDA